MAGFKDLKTGKSQDIYLIKSQADLRDFMEQYVTVHRPLYREAFSCRKHENPEAASAIWDRMLHICASRSVLLDTECTVTAVRHQGRRNIKRVVK